MRTGITSSTIRRAALAIGVFATLSACGAAKERPASPPSEVAPEPAPLAPARVEEAARGAVEQYRQAYDVLTFDGLAPLYAQGPEVEVIAQGERYTGWEAVRRYLQDLLGRADEVRLHIGDLRVVALGRGSAIATAEIERSVRGPVTSVDAAGVLSLAFRREDGRWLIVSEHLSYTTELD